MTTYFDHTDHDCDRVTLSAVSIAPPIGPRASITIRPSDGGRAGIVDLGLGDVEELYHATGRLLSDYKHDDRPDQPNPTDTDIRRAAALALAKETLGTGMHPPEALLTLADWLLGNTDTTAPITVNVSGDVEPGQIARQIQQQLGRRANG